MSDTTFNTDAESAVLSLLLKQPDNYDNIRGLKSFMFSSMPHQLLFSTIEDLVKQGLIPDINLIENYLKAKGKDAQTGGKEYLNLLLKLPLKEENVREYERQVINNYKTRALLALSANIQGATMSSDDIDETLTVFKNKLDSLTDSVYGETTLSLENVLKLGWEDIVVRVANPGIRGITTGYKKLDYSSAGMSGGDVWYIAGRPGMGKTALWLNIALTQARNNIPILGFSLEMKESVISDRLVAIESSIPQMDIRLGLLNQPKLDLISNTMKTIKNYPLYLDFNYYADSKYIASTVRKFKRLHDIKVVYLDYIQLAVERSADATNELGRFSREMKQLANDLDVCFVILSQLNREVEKRDDKRPMASDLRQSGNLEEDADIVVGLYRDIKYHKDTKYKDLLETIIIKQRNGPTGTIPLTFVDDTNKIIDR